MKLKNFFKLACHDLKVNVKVDYWADNVKGHINDPKFQEEIAPYLDKQVTGFEVEATNEMTIYI